MEKCSLTSDLYPREVRVLDVCKQLPVNVVASEDFLLVCVFVFHKRKCDTLFSPCARNGVVATLLINSCMACIYSASTYNSIELIDA